MNETMNENAGSIDGDEGRSMMDALLQAEAHHESEMNRDNPKETPASRNMRSSLANYEIAGYQARLNNNNNNASTSDTDTDPAHTVHQLPRTRSREDLVKISNEKISRVEKSWYIISSRIGEIGLKVFLRMFQEYPELIKLFPFGADDIDPKTGTLILNNRTKAHVRAHATAVMRVVGTSVAGLTSLEELVPRLRQVGATHKTVGVQSMHYDILFRHLMRAIRDEVGPDNWDQETEDAWDQAFTSISDLIKRPSTRLDTEPLRGWGIVMLVACVYFMFVTPFRFAGFLYGRPRMVTLLNILDGVAALVLAIDLTIDFAQSAKRTPIRGSLTTSVLTATRNLVRKINTSFYCQDNPFISNGSLGALAVDGYQSVAELPLAVDVYKRFYMCSGGLALDSVAWAPSFSDCFSCQSLSTMCREQCSPRAKARSRSAATSQYSQAHYFGWPSSPMCK